MKVFVTGATGWVGSIVVQELVGAGHAVTGLVRSEAKVAGLDAAGAKALRGTLDDLDALRAATRAADAVLHLAFNHDDFSKFKENGQQDVRAIEAMTAELVGTDKPILVTSGVAMLREDGGLGTETDRPAHKPEFPRQTERAAEAAAARGVRIGTVRLAPSTHGLGGDHGFVAILTRLAREQGVSAYVGDGSNRWAAVHRTDAGRLYRLALESGVKEAAYHAIAEEGVPFKAIATAIGKQLGLPVESRPAEHFGWFGMFAAADLTASSARTRAAVQWQPTGPTLLEDIGQPAYYVD